ncbi:MAG: type II toxin-antitoxin system VapC family toxin [Rhodoferax sp.]|nr:type II toxin-antitoxin system VapC family toxin [Rhodoferax sp.]
MKKRVYLETSIVSYLTSRPSRDLVTAANQQISHEWWERRHLDFELVASSYVWVEAAAGDPQAARERLALLEGIVQLPWSPQVEALAEVLCAQGALPLKARIDALHVAAAAVAAVEYLLTWNCTHIANAETLPRIEAVCREQGFEPPRISTPLELLGIHRHLKE